MGRIIKRIAPDVYHYPHLDAPVFTGEIPVVATVHDSNSNKDVKKFDDKFGLKSVYFKKALGSTLKHASKVIFVSDSIKKEILNSYNLNERNQKFIRIHNGFEPSFNQINEAERQSILTKLECTAPYILFVGQIREHKNIHRSVEAFKAFQLEHPQYKLVIVGHNYLQLELNGEHITHFDKVSNKELKALYSGCSAFLFPSLFEGFGFPILEAFSFGKPVITSNYGATAEISGEQAILVDPTSVTSISAGIARAIQPDNMSQDRVAHTAQFSWKENATALRKIYLEVSDKTS
jgi:glycosyltransferase involved in cell wall biosynthesis